MGTHIRQPQGAPFEGQRQVTLEALVAYIGLEDGEGNTRSQFDGGILDQFEIHAAAIEALRERTEVAVALVDLPVQTGQVPSGFIPVAGDFLSKARDFRLKLVLHLGEASPLRGLVRLHPGQAGVHPLCPRVDFRPHAHLGLRDVLLGLLARSGQVRAEFVIELGHTIGKAVPVARQPAQPGFGRIHPPSQHRDQPLGRGPSGQ